MKTTYSAWFPTSEVIKEGFETSDLALEFADKYYPKLPFVINRDHINSKGKLTKSSVVCRSNGTGEITTNL